MYNSINTQISIRRIVSITEYKYSYNYSCLIMLINV